MIKDMKKFFQEVLAPAEDDEAGPEAGIEHATAALLIELSKADFEDRTEERDFIIRTLKRSFDLDQRALNELIEWADAATDDAHDLYQFTKLVNEHYSHADKEKLLEKLWKVAYVDGRIDRY
ncbi:MAG: TerB family tellurite resistance protein, partial [Pseudomonadales bacterium]|nr:TerB family tellurite resistance protein [Pseudomonadales bacterium]